MNRPWFKFNFSYPLTCLGAALFLFLGVQVSYDLWSCSRLKVQVSGTIEQLKVVKKSSSSFPLQAVYRFDFQEKIYRNTVLLSPPYHLNRASALKAIKNLEHRQWAVWIDPKHPEISALQKVFPIKKIIYVAMALAVTCYFGFLETNSRMRNPIH
jgi:hypothetical protein